MIYYLAVITLLLLINTSFSAPTKEHESIGLTTYDQKQSGKYNIHLNIKDVAIIALESETIGGGIGDFNEDYYDYDISDFTIKPIFGVIGDLPPVNSTPSIFHSEPTESFESVSSSNNTNVTSTQTDVPSVVVISTTTTEKPDGSLSSSVAVNKTQNVVILSDQPSTTTPASLGSVTILNYNDTAANDSGIVVTTKTPTDEELPPKLPLEQLANGSKLIPPVDAKPNIPASLASLASYPTNAQTEKQHHHPSEIPVQIVMEPLLGSGVRQNVRNKPKPAQRVHYKIRATPAGGVRRITPPRVENIENIGAYGNAPALAQTHHRRTAHVNGNRRRCATDQDGRCQTKRSGM